MEAALLFSIFIILFLLHVPIALSLAISSVLVLALTTDFNLYMVAQRMFSALESPPLMAIPGFVLAGAIMAHGGISRYLIAALRAWVGHLRGGLSVVTILACMIFAAISGSSPATAAAIGGILIPAMVEAGYEKRYAMGLVAASGTLGILIPPSITFVLIGVTANESIGKLFMAGVLPGILLGGVLLCTAIIYARIKNYGGEPKVDWKTRWQCTWKAIPGFLLPVIILGSIYGGICTPTEASIVSVFYALFVTIFIYREMTWSRFRSILREAIGITSMIFLIIPAAMTFAMYLTSEQIPAKIAQWIAGSNLGVAGFWVAVNTMFFVMGTFLEAVSIVLITLPILIPIIKHLDINMLHFAVIMVINMELAMITPPVGLNLFVVSGIGRERLEEVVKGVLPFITVMILTLICLILFPKISLYLPSLMR
ncbi:TRAP transporter large permease [Desulfofundulus thermosubterraneus]|uniref:C4-dicarboxylate transporter, DctM subunit n=1 Tax=Desulfofundulus thermosubterraneus DSM 16057 TaxID=1121432 RepID=A0A1M6G4N7_9FIRM|nr:TRAP transporter large permease [Desulfofundulus thermosubterraneus]SHJ04946.1 C4-dicarboxylate transporter, DctM subunit [Desulfofundulus thermosubterraneus DSM 16057]